jgi:hypothetical protein
VQGLGWRSVNRDSLSRLAFRLQISLPMVRFVNSEASLTGRFSKL